MVEAGTELICKSSTMLGMECHLCPTYTCAHRYGPGATLMTPPALPLCLVISCSFLECVHTR